MGYDPSVVNAWAQAYGTPAASTYSAPATTNYGNLSSGIGQDVLSRMKNTSMWDPSGGNGSGGSWGYEGGETTYGSDPNGNPTGATTAPRFLVYHPQGQGVGEQYPYFDPNTGEFKGYRTGSKVQSYASGVLSVLGAGLGFGAIGAEAGAAGAAAGGGAEAGAGAAAGGTGAGAATTAAGSGGLGSILSGIGGGGSSISPSMLGTIATLLKGASSSGGGNGNGAGGGGVGGLGGLGGGLGSIAGLLGGGLDYYNQSKAADTMRQWLDANQAKMDHYMDPSSPEYTALWDQMNRNDAAAGRNSQYGPRTSDFAAKVAQAKAANTLNFTTGNSRAYAAALNQKAAAPAGLAAAVQKALTGGGGTNLSSLIDLLSKGSSTGTGVNSYTPYEANTVDQIYNNGGAPIDYGNGSGDPSEQDVMDFMNRWGQ